MCYDACNSKIAVLESYLLSILKNIFLESNPYWFKKFRSITNNKMAPSEGGGNLTHVTGNVY